MLWQGVCERQDNYYKKCDISSVRVFDKAELCLAAWAQLCCAVPRKSAERRSFFFFLGKKLGYTFNNRNFHNVSLGQGQEVVAEQALDLAAKEGHWVILQVRWRWKQPHHSWVTRCWSPWWEMGQSVICVSKAKTFGFLLLSIAYIGHSDFGFLVLWAFCRVCGCRECSEEGCATLSHAFICFVNKELCSSELLD